MSSMTVGVNRKFWPRIRLLRAARRSPSNIRGGDSISSSRDINVSSEHQLLLGRLKVVIVPELLAGDDLAHILDTTRSFQAVHAQLAREPGGIKVGHFSVHRVDAERFDVAADIDDPVIHGIAEILAGVAEDHHASTLHHEAAKCAGPPAGNDGAALHVD